MFDFEKLKSDLSKKKYVLNELNLNFDEEQLNFIYDTIWSFYLGHVEQTEIAFQKESFELEKDWKNFKFIKIKFNIEDVHILFNFLLYFLTMFCKFDLNLNNNYKYSINLLENSEENNFEIDEAYNNNKQLFINLFKNLKNKNNELIISFNDEQSKSLLMSLIFMDFSYKTIINPKIDIKVYYFHNLKKYINL